MLDTLPADLVFELFSWLRVQDLNTIACTCKRLRTATQDNRLSWPLSQGSGKRLHAIQDIAVRYLAKYERVLVELNKPFHCAFAAEPGSGKTVVMLSNILMSSVKGKTLIIVPPNLIAVWVSEVEKFWGSKPPFKMFILHSSACGPIAKLDMNALRATDIVLVSSILLNRIFAKQYCDNRRKHYEAIRKEFETSAFVRVIVDEYHTIPRSSLVKNFLEQWRSCHFYFISATPKSSEQFKAVFPNLIFYLMPRVHFHSDCLTHSQYNIVKVPPTKEIKDYCQMVAWAHRHQREVHFSSEELNARFPLRPGHPKIHHLVKVLSFIPKNESVIIFTRGADSTKNLIGILKTEKEIQQKLFQYHAKQSIATRANTYKKFNHDETATIFVVNARIGTAGLNLQKANHLIFMDACFSRKQMRQMQGRIKGRIGQEKRVSLWYLVFEETREMGIVEVLGPLARNDEGVHVMKSDLTEECVV